MQKKSVNFLYLFAISMAGMIMLINSGCTGKGSGDAFGSLSVPTTPSPGPTTPPTFPTLPDPPTGPPVSTDPTTIVDQAAFRVGLTKMVSVDGTGVSADFTLAYVHQKGNFSAPCQISADVTSAQDMECIIEIPEGDVYLKDLSMDINLPDNMCRYMQSLPYWFYKQEVGEGPKDITIVRNFLNNASGDPVFQNADCVFDGVSHDCTGVGGTPDPHPEINVTVRATDEEMECIYDKTGTSGQKNCCMGSFKTTFITKNPMAATPVVVTGTRRGTWGGTYGDCIGGPGAINWSKTDRNRLPIPLVIPAGVGFHSQYEVTGPANARPTPLSGNMSIANFYTPALHSHHGFVASTDTSTKPYAIEPIDDLDGSPIPPGNDSYEFRCMDSASETKHRIRMYIREWDTYPDYLDYLTSGGGIEHPDRLSSEVESGDCTGITGACGDYLDLDNLVNIVLPETYGYAASYETTSADYSKRPAYFPGDFY